MHLCGRCDAGSIPAEGTTTKTSTRLVCFFCVPSEKVTQCHFRQESKTLPGIFKENGDKVYRSCNERFPAEAGRDHLVYLKRSEQIYLVIRDHKTPKPYRRTYGRTYVRKYVRLLERWEQFAKLRK